MHTGNLFLLFGTSSYIHSQLFSKAKLLLTSGGHKSTFKKQMYLTSHTKQVGHSQAVLVIEQQQQKSVPGNEHVNNQDRRSQDLSGSSKNCKDSNEMDMMTTVRLAF